MANFKNLQKPNRRLYKNFLVEGKGFYLRNISPGANGIERKVLLKLIDCVKILMVFL